MMIRPATEADIPVIVQMGVEFLTSVPPYNAWPPSLDTLHQTAQMMVTTKDYVILVAGTPGYLVGMLGMAKYHHPLTGEVTASEMFWWVEPAHRGRVGLLLLKAAETWAVKEGAKTLHMVAPNPDIERLYRKLGFTPIEVSFHKRLESQQCSGYTEQATLNFQEAT